VQKKGGSILQKLHNRERRVRGRGGGSGRSENGSILAALLFLE